MESLLRHLRLSSGVRQSELAAAAGVSQGHVSDIEVGRRDMTSVFATKAAAVLDADPVLLLAGHEFEKVAKAAEEEQPDAPQRALALAKRLLELVQEPGALDEEQAAKIQELVAQLIQIMEGKKPPVAAPHVAKPVPGEPLGTKLPATKATAGTLTQVPRAGVLDEDEILERISGLDVEDLQDLADQVQTKLSSYHAGAAERANLERIYDVVMLRIAELTGDGDRSTFQELAGDRAVVKARRSAEAREQRNQQECYEELGLDAYGRPVSQARRDHDRALKSASFLSQDEKELGTDYRGVPLTPQRLRDRRYVETGRRD